jgi:probable phosphoglycerate mutase
MLLYIIRHGEPDYTTDSLTADGKRQAKALAKRLSTHGLDEIFSSPLGRAIQTAQPTCDRLKLPYKIEEWMSENKVWDDFSIIDDNGTKNWSFGCQNTKLISQDDSSEWHTNPVFSTCKSALDGYRRIVNSSDDFLNRLGYKRDGKIYKVVSPNEKRVAAFCHHGLGTAWLSHLLSIPPHVFWSGFDIAHSSVTVLEFKNNPDGHTAPQCICLSDISHIYKEKLPIKAAIRFYL